MSDTRDGRAVEIAMLLDRAGVLFVPEFIECLDKTIPPYVHAKDIVTQCVLGLLERLEGETVQ